MRLVFLLSLCGLTAGQTETPAPTTLTTPTTVLSTTPGYGDLPEYGDVVEFNITDVTGPRPTWFGPDWVPMVGGTELTDVAYPQAVPIRQDGQLVNGRDNFECFAVIAGADNNTDHDLFTSGFCQVAGYISKKYGESGDDIALTKHPLSRTKRQTAVRKTRPFNIDYYTFNQSSTLKSVYTAGELILDKSRFANLMGLGNVTAPTPAIVLASTPYKAAAVSIDQGKCSDWYSEVYLPSWPAIMPEGVFCVTNATVGINAYIANGVTRQIEPGLPCLDSLGSPVLIGEKFNEVLGIVVISTCDFAVPVGVSAPKFALAVSLAHGLEWDYIIMPTNPPYPSKSSTEPTPRKQDVTPFIPYVKGGVSSFTVSRALSWGGVLFRALQG